MSVNGIASDFLLSQFGNKKTSTHKSDSHYGIKEDLESNKLYEDYLKKESPEVALYTEEGERNLKSEFVWVVDPIEGTSNYSAANPFWATQIALLHNNEPVIAVVNAPVLKQKFVAVKGQGATCNNRKIEPSDLEDLSKSLIDMVRGTKDEDKDWAVNVMGKYIKKVRTNRIFGSCGLSICFAASGVTDLFIAKGSNIYDMAPGTLVAREAGASVVNLQGKDWNLNDEGLIVGNNTLTKELVKVINEN